MAFRGFNFTKGTICQWFFVDIPVTNVTISGNKNVENNKELSSNLGVRYAFHGKEFMKMDDCQGNYMEINPKEFSTNQKEMWEVWANSFKPLITRWLPSQWLS